MIIVENILTYIYELMCSLPTYYIYNKNIYYLLNVGVQPLANSLSVLNIVGKRKKK